MKHIHLPLILANLILTLFLLIKVEQAFYLIDVVATNVLILAGRGH